MKIFNELDNDKLSVVDEKKINKWEEMDILKLSIEKGKDNFVFYDGPATANAMPGLHHMIPKILKDTFCKYKTMQGYKVYRKVGWDTHGLPVETGVEKKLGFASKLDIEKYGVLEFNKKCRESVWENEKAFSDMTKKMGQFIDLKNPYVTYDNNYIETEWWILKNIFDKGLIYEGHKILPYCTRCGTGLSSHEVAQGYKEVDVDTVIVPFKKKDEDVYFLVWTTTPWTLLSNVALCVNPKEKYVKVESKGNKFILAEKLLSKVFNDETVVLEEYLGSDLEYIEYEQLLPFLKVDKKAFFMTNADYVTMEDGTGIVHIAPAFGQDDYEVGRKYNLPVLNPISEEGKFTAGPWENGKALECDLDIIKYLKSEGKLFSKLRIKHNYPHCWRCDNPLLYYSKPSWYIEVTKIKDELIKNNNTVNWYPAYVGEKRFGNWLENVNDWALSRNRYWGTPLNIWKCECGHLESIGSRKELVEKSIEEIDENIELHKPYVDDVHITCSKCGNIMNRVPEVIDCWFDSGSMPFAQYHYPFENQDIFENQFPADFISEGIDQTRGWFYTLLVISTFVTGKTPYKNVLVNDLLLDKNGSKMSKSRGNTVNPFEIMDKYGADAVRWYLLNVSPIWLPTRFNEEGLKEVNSKFFNTLKNTYTFFSMYANADNVDPRNFEVSYEELEEIDKWLLSKYHKLVKYVTDSYDEYDLYKVVKAVTDFVCEDLSNWYIRRNRRRFWDSELTVSKKAVYKTTFDVLVGLTKLIAPIVPFITDEIYINLTNEQSVHLTAFPKHKEDLIVQKIEERMDLVRTIISLGRNAREESKIKVRQPISECIVDGKYEDLIGDLTDLITEELNVKQVIFEKQLDKYMNYIIKPNFKVAGPIFGAKIKLFSDYLSNISSGDLTKLNNDENIVINIDNTDYEINKEMIDIRINSKEGFNAAMENNHFMIINTHLTYELIKEGIARELVSKVQQMRKNNGYEVTDRIDIYYDGDIQDVLNNYEDFVKYETLADNIIKKDTLNSEVFGLNGIEVKLELNKN